MILNIDGRTDFDFLNEFFFLLTEAIVSSIILFFVSILPLLLWLDILKK